MRILTIVVVVLVASSATVFAQFDECWCREPLIWDGGGRDFSCITLRGGLGFAGSMTGDVWVLDLRNPEQPREIGSWQADPPGAVDQLVVDGARLWVLNGYVGVSLVDIGDPTAPATVGHLVLDEGQALGLAAADGLAAISSFDRVQLVVPVTGGGVEIAATVAEGLIVAEDAVAITGDRLVIGAWQGAYDDGRLLVYDVSDPHLPVLVTDLSVHDTFVADSWATEIVGAEASGDQVVLMLAGPIPYGTVTACSVVDPSQPIAPAPAASWLCPGGGGMTVRGDVVASVMGDPRIGGPNQLTLGNLEQPTRVARASQTDSWGEAGMMATDGRHVWISEGGVLELHDFSCCDLLEVVSDDFESTDTTVWSDVAGASGPTGLVHVAPGGATRVTAGP